MLEREGPRFVADVESHGDWGDGGAAPVRFGGCGGGGRGAGEVGEGDEAGGGEGEGPDF